MTELNLTQLFYLLETLLEQQPERPIPIIQRSQQKPLTFWLSGIGTAPLADSEIQDLDDLIGKLKLQTWHTERDFSSDVIVYLRGNVAELERNICQLFELEHGIRPRFTLAARFLGQIHDTEQYACLLYLNGLHAYMPFVNWRNNPKCVIYYHYLPSKQSGTEGLFTKESEADGKKIGGIYVQWEYELPADFSSFDRYYQLNNRLILLGQALPDRYILTDAQFFPLLDLFKLSVEATPDLQIVTPQLLNLPLNLQLNIGPLRDFEIEDSQPFSKSSLLKFNMTLRSGYDSIERFEGDENALQEQIEYLQLQLEKVRLDKEAGQISTSSLYVYEELRDHPYIDGLDSLRQFIARQSERYLANFEYQQLELELDSAKRVFHLVRRVNTNQQNSDGFNPPSSNYQFYLEQQWSDLIGYKIYLPMDSAGRPMEFYPALLPTSKEMANKFKPALLGKNNSPGTTLLLWPDPWPDGQTIKAMIRVIIPAWKSLRETQQFINFRAIKEAVQTIHQPSDPIALVRDVLYGGPLPSDTIQQLAEQQAVKEVQTAWDAKKKEIDEFISASEEMLNQAAQAEIHRKQMDTLFKQISELRRQKLEDWTSFAAAVRKMDQEISQYPKAVGKRFEDILDDVRQEHQSNKANLEQLVADFKREVGSNAEYLTQAANHLRQLADDLTPLNRKGRTRKKVL